MVGGGVASGGDQAARLVTDGGTKYRARPFGSVIVVVVVALAVRVVYLVETRDAPLVQELVGDAAAYQAWAQRIVAGDWIGDEAFYQAPLYPYTLAVIFKLFGDGVWVIRLVQSAWGAMAAGLLCLAATRLFGKRSGILAGLMWALYPPAIMFDGMVQKASLGGFLTCALVAGLTGVCARMRGGAQNGASFAQAEARGSGEAVWRFGAIGVLVGLLCLVRENALVWVPLVLMWVLVAHRSRGATERIESAGGLTSSTGKLAPADGPPEREGGCSERVPRNDTSRWWVGVVAYLVGVVVVLGPVAARNAAVDGGWSVTTFQAGPNFYIGNSAEATGRYRPLVRGHETPAFERADATALAERDVGRELSPEEVSDYWMRRAWSDIRAGPGRWARLMGRKLLMTVNAYEVSDVEGQYVYEGLSYVLAALGPMWHFGVLVPLAGVGVVATRRDWRRLWLLYALMASMAVAVAAFYVMARYRFPLAVLMVPFAGAGLVWAWDRIGQRRWRAVSCAAVVAVVLAVVSNWPLYERGRLDALAWMNVGTSLAQRGELAAATEYFAFAVEEFPQSGEANYNLAQALALQGRYAEAVACYRRAVAVAPDLPRLDYNLAVALERVGNVEDAVEHYRRAVARDPDDAPARTALERLEE
jgi:tetratricopeptide (TPR) repeat protein